MVLGGYRIHSWRGGAEDSGRSEGLNVEFPSFLIAVVSMVVAAVALMLNARPKQPRKAPVSAPDPTGAGLAREAIKNATERDTGAVDTAMPGADPVGDVAALANQAHRGRE